MTDTATPETGPVDAPASLDSIVAQFEAGGDDTADALESVTQEMVNEAEGPGDADEAPATEDDATEAENNAETPEESNPDEPVYTVKVNGEDREVPLAELLKGYSRTEDYKAKTTAVAEERRALDAYKGTLESEVQAQYASQLQQQVQLFEAADPLLAQARNATPQEIDQFKRNDPAGFVAWQDDLNHRMSLIENAKARLSQFGQQQTQAQQRQEAAEIDRAAYALVDLLPDLADETKFEGFVKATFDYARDTGFAPEILREVAKVPAALVALDKARLWDAHQKAIADLPAKKIVPKSTVKPLTTDGSGSRVSAPRFPSSASRDGKADWIANAILAER